MRSRTALAALFLALSSLPLASPASAAAPPTGAVWDSVYFPSRDGTMLHGDLLRPAGGCPEGGCPVIVSVGPYFGHGTQGSNAPLVPTPTYAGPSDRFYDFIAHNFPGRGNIFQQGYAWLQVDSRGYGVSGGCNDYGGPGEQSDVAAAVEWAGTRPWSNGKVGMWGKSYDAWTQVMGLAMNPPHLEAVVIQAPIIDGYGIAYVNGVHHDALWYATTSLYQLYDWMPPAVGQAGRPEIIYPVAGLAGDCWPKQQALIAAGWDRDNLPANEYWRQRDLRPSAGRNDDVAVLWSHGFNDINTKPDQIFGVYGRLNDLPKSNHRAWFGGWAHWRGNESQHTGRTGFLEESLDWFDHYLRGRPFRYSVNEKNVVEVQDNEGRWRTEATYPPADVKRITLPIRDGSYVDNNSTSATAGYWTFSQPLEHDLRIAGEPTVTLNADIAAPWGNVIVVLYDHAANGQAREISRGAYRFSGDGPVTFTLHPRDHIVRKGRRLAIHVTSGHPQFLPHFTQQSIAISEASITVPFLHWERLVNLTGGQASSQARLLSGVPFSTGAAVEMPLPGPMEPYPTDDEDETRERIQPSVVTPAG
ncbi:MAG TPA: CocE/NonD family hydrolase [Actinomycetota bacterium]|nr:CocE/NonD family hydrolase [Actinomycetota bacterium]